MRSWGLVACAAALTISNAAWATGGSLAPVGLVDAGDAGEASSSALDQSGFRITPALRLRWNMTDRFSEVVHGASPMKVALVDVRKHRRQGMMADYYPIAGSGFFLSAGWRKSPARSRWAPGMASIVAPIFAPRANETLRVATNIARRAPAMMAGWEGALGANGLIGLSVGALQETVRGVRMNAGASPFGENARWSRVGGLAQVNFGFKF